MSRNASRSSDVNMDFALFEGIAQEVEANEREREEFFKVTDKADTIEIHGDVDVGNRMDSPMSHQSFHIDSTTPLKLFPPNRPVSNVSEYTDELEGKQSENIDQSYEFDHNSNKENKDFLGEISTNDSKPEYKLAEEELPKAEKEQFDHKLNQNIEQSKLQKEINPDIVLTHSGETRKPESETLGSGNNQLVVENNGNNSTCVSRSTIRSGSSYSDSFSSCSSSDNSSDEDNESIVDEDKNLYDNNDNSKEPITMDKDDDKVLESNEKREITNNVILKDNDSEESDNKDVKIDQDQDSEITYGQDSSNNFSNGQTTKENESDNHEDDSLESTPELDKKESNDPEPDVRINHEESKTPVQESEKDVSEDSAKGDYDEAGDKRYHLRELEIISDDEYDDVNLQEIRQARVELSAFTRNFDNFCNIINELEKEPPKEEEENEEVKEEDNDDKPKEEVKSIRFDLGNLEDLSRPTSSHKKQETPNKNEKEEKKEEDIVVVVPCTSCGEEIYDEYTLPNLEELFQEEKTCAKCYSEKKIEENYFNKSILEDIINDLDDSYSDKNTDSHSDKNTDISSLSTKQLENKKKKSQIKSGKSHGKQKTQKKRIKKEVKPKLEAGFTETDDTKLLDWLSEKQKAEKKKKREERRERKERIKEKKKKQKEEEERAKLAQQKLEEWNARKQKESREKKKANISVNLKTNISKPIIHNQNKVSNTKQSTSHEINPSNSSTPKRNKKLAEFKQPTTRNESVSPPPLEISEENSFERFRENYLSSKDSPKGFTSIESFVETVIHDAVEEMERDSRVKIARLKRPKSHVHFNDNVETKTIAPSKPKSAGPTRLTRRANSSHGQRATVNDSDRRSINRRLLRSKTYDEWLMEKKQRQDLKAKEQEINDYYDKLEEKLLFLEKERRKALVSVRSNNWKNEEKLPDLSKRLEPQGSEIQYYANDR